MNAYICVYYHRPPSRAEKRCTQQNTTSNQTLRRFLDVYDDKDCYYDWGDDPSFFAASHLLGDARYATWGVCRPDVRGYLNDEDFVVFFCAKSVGKQAWEYFYIGVGTVACKLTRENIWLDKQYAKYQNFFNILARFSNGVLEHYEIICPYHDNWQQRCEKPYLLFNPQQSQFNLVNPLHVATYTKIDGPYETWYPSKDQQVTRLKTMLFPEAAPRQHLRINNHLAHRHINLQTQLGQKTDFKALRSNLLELVTNSL